MKINRSTNHTLRNSLIALAGLTVLGVAGYFVYATYFAPKDSAPNTVNYDKPTKEQIKSGENTKKDTVNQDSSNNGSSDPKLQEPTKPSSIKTTITAASVEGSTLYIRNSINGIYQTGTCTLTLTKSGSTVTKSAGVQPLPKASTCKGFNVNTSELSSGTWNVELTVKINGETAKASTTVKV